MRTLTTAFLVTAALSGCSPTTTLPHPIAHPAVKQPCMLNLPMRGAVLPTAGDDSYLSRRTDSASGGTTHDGVDLWSDSPGVFAVRSGKIDQFGTKAGEGMHSGCIPIIVANDDDKTTLDIYCGLRSLEKNKTGSVQTGQLLGYAHSPFRTTYAMHFGVSELSLIVGGGVVEMFHDPQQVLATASHLDTCR